MATRETRADRGRRLGQQLGARLLNELRTQRTTHNVSQRATAAALGWSQTEYWRFERGDTRITLADVSSVASVLGLELGAGLHPKGDPIRDKGHHALIRRFRAELSPLWRVVAELPLPTPGDPRAWDLLIRVAQQKVGVEAETRLRDMQAIVRHVHLRERDGGADEVVVLLAASRTNRALVDELRASLGGRYVTSPRELLRALRAGRPVPGSGVLLL